MPEYIYQNPETEEIVSIFQGMNDPHEYECNGVKYVRIFTSPQAITETPGNPFSVQDFVDKTNKPGKLGDVFDRSADMSRKRAAMSGGIDPWVTKRNKEKELGKQEAAARALKKVRSKGKK